MNFHLHDWKYLSPQHRICGKCGEYQEHGYRTYGWDNVSQNIPFNKFLADAKDTKKFCDEDNTKIMENRKKAIAYIAHK